MNRPLPVVVAGLLSLSLVGPVRADVPFWDSERLLIPLYTETPIEGAFGSRWAAELSLVVRGDRSVLIVGALFSPCQLSPCLPDSTPPGVTFYPLLEENKLKGAYLWVDKDAATGVQTNLRARDLSRQAEDWGTEVPTIRESEAPFSSFEILDVPADERFRVMLRVYQFGEGTVPGTLPATIRLYETKPEQRVLNASVPPDPPIGEFPIEIVGASWATPGYAEVANLVVPPPFNAGRYRIKVVTDDGVRIWGFVTITNNDTQHVTVMSAR